MLKFDESEFKKFANAIFDFSAGVYEFRALNAAISKANKIELANQGYEPTLAGWFDRVDHIRFEAKRLHGVSGYLTVNPINSSLASDRWKNELKYLSRKNGRYGTEADDVALLRYMIVDIDVERGIEKGNPKEGISATNEELALALGKRDEILDAHPKLRDAALWGTSGNGGWILVRLPDYPNDQKHRDLVAGSLHTLAERHGKKKRDKAFIDTDTKNPNRHLGIPGTLKCKGADLPDRPWRIITVDGRGF
ncbi:hypothetical protein [Singulisphaera sp. GP187]|uniref:hypothetical protein n=1 Tax=Singulisphaera sp. GP187 TaxID=1882752 RepID=UPI0011611AED|nr:hypothetical protein [Singulisphaera sp. GP187]